MNNSVMSTSKIRPICKTGYMGYCDSSAYQGLPFNSRYIIIDGSSSIEGDIQDLYNKISELTTTVNEMSSSIEGINSNIANLNTRVTALEESSGTITTSNQIILLYSDDVYTSNIVLEQAITNFKYIIAIVNDSGIKHIKIMDVQDIFSLSSNQYITFPSGTSTLQYSVSASRKELISTSDTTPTAYIETIIGISIA